MTTVTLEVRDEFLPKLNTILELLPKKEVKIKRDLLKEEVQRRIDDIKSGKEKTVPFDSMWREVDLMIARHKNDN